MMKGSCEMHELAAVLAVTFVLATTAPPLSVVPLAADSRPPIRLIAHRGLSVLAPENTLPAIQLAGAYGLSACEFDVYPTADGVWVLSHDPTVDAMTDGTGFIRDLTAAQIARLTVDAGSYVERYPGLTPCTLADALDCCAERGITPVLDVKTGTHSQLDALVELLRQKKMLEHTIVLSYGYDILQYLRTGGDVIPLYLLVSAVDRQSIAKAASLPNTGLDFRLSDPANTPAALAEAKAAGLSLIAWVADTPEALDALDGLGIDFVTTNRLVPPLGEMERPAK